MVLTELRTRIQPYHARLEALVNIPEQCRDLTRSRSLLERFTAPLCPWKPT